MLNMPSFVFSLQKWDVQFFHSVSQCIGVNSKNLTRTAGAVDFTLANLSTRWMFHNGKKTKSGGSPLGLRLVAALQAFGMVHHTVWMEMENQR